MLIFSFFDFTSLFLFTSFGYLAASAQVSSLIIAGIACVVYKIIFEKSTSSSFSSWESFKSNKYLVLKYLIAGVVLMAVRGGLIHMLEPLFTQHIVLVILPTVVLTALVLLFVDKLNDHSNTLLILGMVLVAYRILYLGAVELLPEEGYYWNYALHPALGYIDHPPIVGWLISMGTYMLGVNEFGARFLAFIIGLLTFFIIVLFHFRMFGKEGIKSTLAVSLVAPYLCGVGFFISPDTPLVLCWSMAVYFLYIAIIEQKKNFWYLAGAAVGFGLLSKYSIVLLAISTIVFCALDVQSRHWFTRKEPYIAAGISLSIFSPVIVWNAINNWASFSFQSTNRMAEELEFSFHVLLFDMTLLVLPTTLAIIALLFIKKGNLPVSNAAGPINVTPSDSDQLLMGFNKKFLFCFIFFIAPALVFTFYSFRHETKFNWTGPTFIALLPWVGFWLHHNLKFVKYHLMAAVIFVCAVSFSLQYLSFGVPLVPYGEWTHRILGWRAVARNILQEANSITIIDGQKPVIAGMDKHFIVSNLSFYLDSFNPDAQQWGGFVFASRNLVGKDALMWDFWSNPEDLIGKTVLMVARSKSDLSDDTIEEYFAEVSELKEIPLTTRGRTTRTYYSRVGHKYKGVQADKIISDELPVDQATTEQHQPPVQEPSR